MWPGIILVIVTSTVVMCPWANIAGEDIGERSRLTVEFASKGRLRESQSTSVLVREETAHGFAADDQAADKIGTLHTLVTSEKRRVLVDGGSSDARLLISGVIGTGALAVVMLDYVEYPAQHTWLKTVAENQLNLPIVSPNGSINDKAAMPESKRTGLDEALKREKDRADALQQQLNALQPRIATLKASEARAAELEDMLEQEKARSISFLRELETLKEQLTALKTSATRAEESENAAALERERADTAHRQLNVLQEQLAVLVEGRAELLADIMREKEQSALTTRRLELALRMVDVLESRAEFIPSTLAFQNLSLALFGSLVEESSDTIDEASVEAHDQVKAEAARMHHEATTAQPAAQDSRRQVNVQPEIQPPEITAESDTLQKGDPPNQQVRSPVGKRATPRFQHRKRYSKVRWSRGWTGYKGGYGNARGTRTTNGPGIR